MSDQSRIGETPNRHKLDQTVVLVVQPSQVLDLGVSGEVWAQRKKAGSV